MPPEQSVPRVRIVTTSIAEKATRKEVLEAGARSELHQRALEKIEEAEPASTVRRYFGSFYLTPE